MDPIFVVHFGMATGAVAIVEHLFASILLLAVPDSRKAGFVPLLVSGAATPVLLSLLVVFSNSAPAGANWGTMTAMVLNALLFLGLMFREIKEARDKARSG